MTERELEQMLAQAIDHAAPDDLEGVFSRCQPQSDNVIALNPEAANSAPQEPAAVDTVEEPAAISQSPAKKRAWWKGLVAAVLALALVGAGAAGGVWYQNNLAVASVVSLDVNPSIELKVNQNEKVLTCDPLNDEAREVLAEMAGGSDLEGAKLDVAVNAIVGALLRHGYLEDISSAILISVEDNNADRGARLQRQLTATVDGVLQNAASQASVLSQNMTVDAGLDSQAQQNSISAGKAALVNRVIAINPALPFDKLAALSVEELRDLIEIGAPALPIGKDAATVAVDQYAGTYIRDLDYRAWMDVDPELDDPRPNYEVELQLGDREYDYRVDAFTGEVYSGQKDIMSAAQSPATQTPAPQTTPTPQATPAPQTTPAPQNTPAPQSTPAPQATPAPQTTPKPQTPAVTDIGVDAAKAAALTHAGLSDSQVTWIKAERDYDDGRLEYELEFIYNSTEYEYTVLASNGSIVKYETEPVRGSGGGSQSNPAPQNTPAPATPAPAPTQAPATPAPTQAPAAQAPADIGAEAAKAAALSHAGLSAGQVSRMKCERDYEHGRIEYEIEFRCNGYEYEYTVDGATGAILDHEVDRDD